MLRVVRGCLACSRYCFAARIVSGNVFRLGLTDPQGERKAEEPERRVRLPEASNSGSLSLVSKGEPNRGKGDMSRRWICVAIYGGVTYS